MTTRRDEDWERQLISEVLELSNGSVQLSIESACENAEAVILRYLRLFLTDILSIPRRRSLRSTGNETWSLFFRDGVAFAIMTADDIMAARQLAIRIVPLEGNGTCRSTIDGTYSIKSAGRYSHVRLVLSESLGVDWQQLARAICGILETGYRSLEQCILIRLRAIEQSAASEIYGLLRSIFPQSVAGELLVYVTMDGKGAYLQDPASRSEALRRANEYEAPITLSPLLQLARFANLVLPAEQVFKPTASLTQVNVLTAPYANSGLHFAEAAMLRSNQMVIQKLAKTAHFRVDVCYSTQLVPIVERKIKNERNTILGILRRNDLDLRRMLVNSKAESVIDDSVVPASALGRWNPSRVDRSPFVTLPHDRRIGSPIPLDNESKERALVGDVISTVALAGQISREFAVSDHGIDMEIEFKDDNGDATGSKMYLQLKSGDSHTRERKRDEAEVLDIPKERHSIYWMNQPFPVMLVIRSSEGEIRWMEIRNWLRHESDGGRKPVKQIVFEGERFDVLSVHRWRDQILGRSASS